MKKKTRSYSITSQTAEMGKIIEDENKEETKVELKVYLAYLKYYGGWRMIFLS